MHTSVLVSAELKLVTVEVVVDSVALDVEVVVDNVAVAVSAAPKPPPPKFPPPKLS